MIKFLLKNSFYITSGLFLIGLILVVVVRHFLNNDLIIMIINYYFWYSFGLFTGMFLARIVIENYTKMVKNGKTKD